MSIDDSSFHETHEPWATAGGLPIACDLDRSAGPYLFDAKSNRELMDFAGFATSLPVGYNHEQLRDKELLESLARLAIHAPVNCETHLHELEQIGEVFDIIPLAGKFACLRFADGVPCAVDAALKVAVAWKQAQNGSEGDPERGGKIIHFTRGFHGRSGWALSATDAPQKRVMRHLPRMDWPLVRGPRMIFPFDDAARAEVVERENAAIQELQAVFAEHGSDIAGIIIEPIQARGGANFFRTEFLQVLRSLCTDRKAALIFDETHTGFGVTGSWWDWQNHEVQPDILVFGRASQVCGIAASDGLRDVEAVFYDGACGASGYCGDLLSVVRCLKLINLIIEQDLLNNAQSMGTYLLRLLDEIPQTHPEVSAVRGRGLWTAFDLPSGEERDRVVRGCFEEEILVVPSGTRSIRLRPPLDISADAVARGVAQLEAGIRRAYNRKA